MAEVDPCLFYNSATLANTLMHYLLRVDELYNKNKANTTAHKRMC